MDVSILIATHRRDDMLRRCLEGLSSLATGGVTWELILIDNAGEPSTRALAESFREAIDLKFLVETTPGKNSALNRGLDEASGALLAFIDDDIVPAADWLIEMWTGAKRYSDCAVFGGRILPNWPDAPHDLPISLDDPMIRAAFCIADWPIAEGRCAADLVWGGNMAIRAQAFEGGVRFNPAVGPNGTDYVMGSESELIARLDLRGYHAAYLPRSVVWHQIRPEQLTVEWLQARAYRDGRQKGRMVGPSILRTAMFLRRHLRDTLFANLRSVVRSDRRAALQARMSYWQLRGWLHQITVEVRDGYAAHRSSLVVPRKRGGLR